MQRLKYMRMGEEGLGRELLDCRDTFFRFYWHYHAEYELFVPIDFNGSYLVGDRTGECGPGHAIVLGPNVPHSFNHVEMPKARPVQSAYCLGFSLASPFIAGLRRHVDFTALEHECAHGLLIQGDDTDKILAILDGFADAGKLEQASRFLRILDLLLTASRRSTLCTVPFNVTRHDESKVNLACKYLNQKSFERIDFEELAQLLRMRKPNLCRFFKNTMGMTITDYVNTLRVRRACLALVGSTQNISEIAYDCGFESLSTFNRTFRKLRSMNPTEFRLHHTRPKA